ncbi:MAG TPA: ribonuclease J [Rhodospirillaceae bacterium]|nr:ribonuclease J [Rhodospirillaceae bacterium]
MDAAAADLRPGLYWQSRMGNNPDGIGGNSHLYEVVSQGQDGQIARARLLVDLGIKLGTRRTGYACEFASPDGALALASTGLCRDGSAPPAALLLTHSHEDHLGAIPHVLEMGYSLPPIHCTSFTAQKINQSLRQAGVALAAWPKVNIVKAGDVVPVAGAMVEFVAMDHMPGAAALYIRTPDASVFHTGDYKFDNSLPLGERADPGRLRAIGLAGVDMVIADSTAAGQSGEKVLERDIAKSLTRILEDCEGRAVVAGILGSQLDRLVSLGRAAAANGRSVIVSGASLAENLRALQLSGTDMEKVVGTKLLTPREGQQLAADKVLFVTTGAFAQPNSGLVRASESLPGAVTIDEDTTVLIPQRAIPPIKGAFGAMIAKLEARGASVITPERAAELGYGAIHQSGHAMEGDAQLLFTLLNPRKMVAPIHGNGSQLSANARIAKDLGIPALTLERNGARVRVAQEDVSVIGYENARRIGAVETGAAKRLPRAANGEGRRAHSPPAIYRYDLLDPMGKEVLAQNVDASRLDKPESASSFKILSALRESWRHGR